jgi:hypothetical protein
MPQASRFRHYSGTAPAGSAPQKVALTRRGVGISITNKDGTNLLEISFDGGRNFYPIYATKEFKGDALMHFFYVRSSAGAAWSAVVAEG